MLHYEVGLASVCGHSWPVTCSEADQQVSLRDLLHDLMSPPLLPTRAPSSPELSSSWLRFPGPSSGAAPPSPSPALPVGGISQPLRRSLAPAPPAGLRRGGPAPAHLGPPTHSSYTRGSGRLRAPEPGISHQSCVEREADPSAVAAQEGELR